MRLSVVVPCFRSEATLTELAERLESSLSSLLTSKILRDYEVLFVIDGSPDGTASLACGLAKTHPKIRVLELIRDFGQHNALVAGIRAARFDTVVTMDDDLQHPPEEIHRLIERMRESAADLIYALPETEEHGPFRSTASQFVKASLALAGVPNAKSVGAFRAFRTELREGFATVTDPLVNLDVLLSWVTTRVDTVTVSMDWRSVGRSGYTFRSLVRHTMNMVTGYGIVPLKLATWLGFVSGFFGLVLLTIVLIQHFTGATTIPGFTTTIAAISIFAGAQMVTIGIIGEYLGRQHFRSMQRPMYVVRHSTQED
ncbi:MAG: glycosyltransferase family 2 protein [Demequinaceae bacterium]|nr:glycosyltransferase family 2 protein [Demequinaceae bacterium]